MRDDDAFAFEFENGKAVRIQAYTGDSEYVRDQWGEEFSYVLGIPGMGCSR